MCSVITLSASSVITLSQRLALDASRQAWFDMDIAVPLEGEDGHVVPRCCIEEMDAGHADFIQSLLQPGDNPSGSDVGGDDEASQGEETIHWL